MKDQRLTQWARFGHRVYRLRKQRGLSLDALAERTNWSNTYLNKIEHARRRPNQGVVSALDRELGTNGGLLRDWTDTLKSESTPGWFEQSRAYEKQATEIRFFHPFAVPGFFQIADYVRAVESAKPDVDEAGMDRAIHTREAWLNDLRETKGLRLHVVVPEMVLRQNIGGPEVMRQQTERLIKEAGDGYTTIQVLPSDTEDCAWMTGAFRIIYMLDQPTVICVEHSIGETLDYDTHNIRVLESAFSKIQTWALPPTTSIEAMQRIKVDH